MRTDSGDLGLVFSQEIFASSLMDASMVKSGEDADNGYELDSCLSHLFCGGFDLLRIQRINLASINLQSSVKVEARACDDVSQCVGKVGKGRDLQMVRTESEV